MNISGVDSIKVLDCVQGQRCTDKSLIENIKINLQERLLWKSRREKYRIDYPQ